MNNISNKIKDDLSAIVQAMTADEFLQLEFDNDCKNNFFTWRQNLVLDKKKILLPEIKNNDLEKSFRAAADMGVGYILFHNQEINANENFNQEEQKLFDEFEKIRVVINVGNSYLGALKNILLKIEEDFLFIDSNSDHLLPLILLDDFFQTKVPIQIKNSIANLKNKTSKKIIEEITNLAQKINDQKLFAAAVEKIIKLLKKEEEKNRDLDNGNLPKPDKTSEDDDVNFNQENIEKNEDNNFSDTEIGQNEIENKSEKIKELKEDDIAGKVKAKLEKQGLIEDKIEYKNSYKIYSNKFDEIIFPQKLLSKIELESLRNQLDLKISKLSGVSRRMSLKLKRKLLSKKNSFVEYNSSRGVLDKKKLSRLIIDPTIEDIWVNHKTHEYNDTALTILLDNSGSMRGNPIVMSALACETIAEILEKFLVKTEIIGFTTGDWKGGRVRKLWESCGRPENPGRLNELRHIIYKHFNQSFKKAKINLGLMLKEGILKENIDGEALLFGRSRLMQQDQKRKILMVISDGTPVDDSTTLVNDNRILTDHLMQVINNIEKKSKIEIVGIGIGHATDDFYKNSITVKTPNDLGDAMIEKLINLL